MNRIEEFFLAHKIVFVLLTILTLPILLIWFLIYGIIIGIVGITIDHYENIRYAIKRDVIELLKYPKWREKHHRLKYLSGIDNKKERERAEMDFMEGRLKVGGMGGATIGMIIYGIFTYPLMLIWGIIAGPVMALEEAIKWWGRIWKCSSKGG